MMTTSVVIQGKRTLTCHGCRAPVTVEALRRVPSGVTLTRWGEAWVGLVWNVKEHRLDLGIACSETCAHLLVLTLGDVLSSEPPPEWEWGAE